MSCDVTQSCRLRCLSDVSCACSPANNIGQTIVGHAGKVIGALRCDIALRAEITREERRVSKLISFSQYRANAQHEKQTKPDFDKEPPKAKGGVPAAKLIASVLIYTNLNEEREELFEFDPLSERGWLQLEKRVRRFKARYEKRFEPEERVLVIFADWLVKETPKSPLIDPAFDHPKWSVLYQVLERGDGIASMIQNEKYLLKLDPEGLRRVLLGIINTV